MQPDKEKKIIFVSLISSVILHLMVIITFTFIENFESVKMLNFSEVLSFEVKESADRSVSAKEDQNKIEDPKITPVIDENTSSGSFITMDDVKADTSLIEQIYKENTLGVSIKFPVGWTYIDQNNKKKLDGVTFWLNNPNISDPPYVFLEVKEKYLFNQNRFKYSFKTKSFTAFYNEPEQMQEQLSQIVYLRTNTDEDYSIKLAVKGLEEFKSVQPLFFNMIKSFKFKNSIF